MISYQTVTIADSASLSSAKELPFGGVLVGVIARTGWTTAGVSFQVSVDGTTYYVLLDPAGAEYTIPAVVAARYVALDPTMFMGVKYVKVQSGTSASTTAQSGGDTVDLVFRQVH